MIDHNTALKAFSLLNLNKELNSLLVVNFSGRFKRYGSNVKYTKTKIEFNLSNHYRTVDESVAIGLFQHYFLRIFKMKIQTEYTHVYDNFVKHVNKLIDPTHQDLYLKNVFDDLNEEFFMGLLGEVNLKWSTGKRTLGKFDFHTNTISITKFLKPHPDLLRFVMFHEMCHKKALFYKTNQKSMYHTGFFKELEELYPNHAELERKLQRTRL